ncbi:glutamate--tRNA ligase family protein [Flavitalea sp. BT771]|uniref:glutamate--tRNA ligase family protein n=1 Tax=Flavitalea sp. BT771 TaxID=3063329 RepID=UPI0026E21C50|nr:glutamate--tRNA ligase family protein [Flavitalea sp. BT771]MDO6434935.1 glutamate--tRNA ligase family protein [Flavitalea sp. BT771]MDV6223835.1 glutamate--tRNA ligase family protein [Flavitalea sp. BT771]
MQPRFNRTRIAPTPSGFLHLGNVASFVLTSRLARRMGARVLLRIDDLDRDRVDERYVQDIFETLHFLGISWDEGPLGLAEFEAVWSQVHRMEKYLAALQALRDQGVLFACSCSRAQIARAVTAGGYPGTCRDKGLSLDAPDVSWRVRTDLFRELKVRGVEAADFSGPLDGSMKDFVVRKKDGFPAYQVTSIIDDLHFGVDLIVRGQDLWPSTLAQMYLSGLLPGGAVFGDACFYHHALLEEGGMKLSKSAGATSVQFLRKEGRTADEIYGLIGQLMPGFL